MPSYKLTIAYDGTQYSGWQIQPNGISIQQCVQNALKVILHQEVPIIGSGRTDAGVHAVAQVAHFRHTEALDLYRLLFSLNGLLPRDIRVKKVEVVADSFHARYSAIGKEYHYHLHLEKVMDPFRRLYCWHVPFRIDQTLLKEAALFFIGTHDFTSFANESHAGSASRDPIRTLSLLVSEEVEGGVLLKFKANGFLYKMVRNIVGTLIEIASGKRFIQDIPQLFAGRNRRLTGQAAPPQGLFLMQVDYPAIFTDSQGENNL